MRMLVVNANTSDVVTEKVAAQARASRLAGHRDRGRHRQLRCARHRHARRARHRRALDLALVAQHAGGCDAVVIAVSYDTGLRAARELLPVPVVGMTEAGLLTACMLGGRIGVVTFGRARAAAVPGTGGAATASPRASPAGACSKAPRPTAAARTPRSTRELVAAASDLVERDGAETCVLTGAVMAGVPARLQRAGAGAAGRRHRLRRAPGRAAGTTWHCPSRAPAATRRRPGASSSTSTPRSRATFAAAAT